MNDGGAGGSSEVVVVGGGAVGLCCALELAGRGIRVTLIERGLPGGANSTLTGGGIRQQFGTPTNLALSRLAAPFWDGFSARFGVDPLFRAIGYLFLARTDDESARLRAQVSLQGQLGVDSEYLAGDEVARRWPCLATGRFAGAAFRQGDGWANQFRIIDGLVRGTVAAGIRLLTGVECLGLLRQGDRVTGVETTTGRLPADAVVLATGPWVGPLLHPLGIDLPVVGHRHELLIVEPAEPLSPGLPWLIGMTEQVHVRPDTPGRALVGGFLGREDRVDPDRFATRPGADWSREVLAAAGRTFGVVDGRARIRHGWAGLYPTTPDRHPIIDRLRDGLYCALGFSGTGLMHAPAAGTLMAELMVDGSIGSVPPAPLAAGRFGSPGGVESTGF